MKKAIGILVLGLLLTSCSETNEKKKSKMIEKCADFEYLRFNDPPKEGSLSTMSIKHKLKFNEYERKFVVCENYFKSNPTTFKEKYLK
jgi:hypothetical protein